MILLAAITLVCGGMYVNGVLAKKDQQIKMWRSKCELLMAYDPSREAVINELLEYSAYNFESEDCSKAITAANILLDPPPEKA